MKLQVGVGSLKELEYFIKNGAAELYCGVYKVPSHVEGARNFETAAEVGEAAGVAHAAGRKLYFAANEVHAGLLDATAGIIKDLVARGVDGAIVKDIALLNRLNAKGVRTELILSTLSCCMNAETLAFYKGLGVKRLALPEQVTPAEAGELVRNKFRFGTEVFHKARECCRNFNGLCFLDCSGLDTNACKKEYRAGNKKFFMPCLSAAEHLGELHDYYRMGVGTLKVGRSPNAEASRLIFGEAKALIALLSGGAGRAKFTAEGLRVMAVYERAYKFIMEKKGWKGR
jgi:hypothetical protein